MNIVIIEDEALAAKKLEELVLRYNPGYKILAKIGSVQGAVHWFNANGQPDLVFMDIHLLDGNSFEIIEQVTLDCPVVFTTAYDDYALEAFEVNSIDYLLKPVGYSKLQKAMDKLIKIQANFEDSQSSRLSNLLNILETGDKEYKSRFLVKTGSKLFSIPMEEIGLFYSEEKVTFLITEKSKRFIITQTLDELEKVINPRLFFRVNRQVILHINSVKFVHKYYKGRLKIELQNKWAPKEIIVSSRRVAGFQAWLDQ
ncbi:LytR/AlgR family response regulator transcription factor [Ulvibacterium sp.]|uniref:LytR/AlgR family response regulator transcription factor n=1 Tax=Ulvibacterium sp. TaxID=2665914 RepID=UPI003BABB39E